MTSHNPNLDIKTGDDLRDMSLDELKKQLQLRINAVPDLASKYPNWGESAEAKILQKFIESKGKGIKGDKLKNQLICSLDALDEWKSEEKRKMAEAERLREIDKEQEKRAREKREKRILAAKGIVEPVSVMEEKERQATGKEQEGIEEKKQETPEEKAQKDREKEEWARAAENILSQSSEKVIRKRAQKKQQAADASRALKIEKDRLLKKYHLAFDKNGMIYSKEDMPDDVVRILIRHIMHLDKLAVELPKNTVEIHHAVNQLFDIKVLNNEDELRAIEKICEILHVKAEISFTTGDVPGKKKKSNKFEKLQAQFNACLSVGNECFLSEEEKERLEILKDYLQFTWSWTLKKETIKLQGLIDAFNQNSLINELRTREKQATPTDPSLAQKEGGPASEPVVLVEEKKSPISEPVVSVEEKKSSVSGAAVSTEEEKSAVVEMAAFPEQKKILDVVGPAASNKKNLTLLEAEILGILKKEMEDVMKRYEKDWFYGLDDSGGIVVERVNKGKNNKTDNNIANRLNHIYSLIKKIETTQISKDNLLNDLNEIKNETEASSRAGFVTRKSTSRVAIEKAIKRVSDFDNVKQESASNKTEPSVRPMTR